MNRALQRIARKSTDRREREISDSVVEIFSARHKHHTLHRTDDVPRHGPREQLMPHYQGRRPGTRFAPVFRRLGSQFSSPMMPRQDENAGFFLQVWTLVATVVLSMTVPAIQVFYDSVLCKGERISFFRGDHADRSGVEC